MASKDHGLTPIELSSFCSEIALMLGAGDTWWVLLSSFANCIVFRVILAITLEHFFQIEGVFVACAIAPSISVPVGMYYTHSGRWRKSLTTRVIEE